MSKLPILSGKKLLALLKKADFYELRRKGSHVFIENAKHTNRTVIPIHGNEELGRGILKSILDDLDLSVEDLIHMIYG